MKNQKKLNKKRVNLLIGGVIGFLVWIILSTMLIVKVTGPSVNVFILRDNMQYSQEYSNPYNNNDEDEAYSALVEYNNSLINSDDAFVSFFFNQSLLMKLVIYASAFIPYLIIGTLVKEIIDDKKTAKKRALKRRAINAV